DRPWLPSARWRSLPDGRCCPAPPDHSPHPAPVALHWHRATTPAPDAPAPSRDRRPTTPAQIAPETVDALLPLPLPGCSVPALRAPAKVALAHLARNKRASFAHT